MRFLLLIFLAFSALAVRSQNLELNKTVEHGYATADTCYMSVLNWTKSRFNDANNRVVLSDQSAGVIRAKGRFNVSYYFLGNTKPGGFITYNLDFKIADNQVEYAVSKLEHKTEGEVSHKSGGLIENEKAEKGSLIFPKTWRNYKKQSAEFISSLDEEIIITLKSY